MSTNTDGGIGYREVCSLLDVHDRVIIIVGGARLVILVFTTVANALVVPSGCHLGSRKPWLERGRGNGEGSRNDRGDNGTGELQRKAEGNVKNVLPEKIHEIQNARRCFLRSSREGGGLSIWILDSGRWCVEHQAARGFLVFSFLGNSS